MKTFVLASAVAASLAVICAAAPVSLADTGKSSAAQCYSATLAPGLPAPTRLDVLELPIQVAVIAGVDPTSNVDPQTYPSVLSLLSTAQLASATTRYTLLDVLGLPIQTALAIVAGGTAGVTLPTSPLIPSPYTSVYTVINNAIAVVRVPLSLALTGQFADIAPQTEAALTTFVTSLTQGLPNSIRGTLNYDRSVIEGFLGSGGHAPNPLSEKPFEPEQEQESDAAGSKRLRAAAVKEIRGAVHRDDESASEPESTTVSEESSSKADKVDKADKADKADTEDKRDPPGKRDRPGKTDGAE